MSINKQIAKASKRVNKLSRKTTSKLEMALSPLEWDDARPLLMAYISHLEEIVDTVDVAHLRGKDTIEWPNGSLMDTHLKPCGFDVRGQIS